MTDSSQQSEPPLASSLEKIRSEFDRWIDMACSQGGRALDAVGLRPHSSRWSPLADVIEDTQNVTVCIDVPGAAHGDVKVELIGNMLTVKGSRKNESVGAEATLHLNERAGGDFSRSIPMPVPVKADEVSAEISNGVLTIQLPKADAAKPKEIPIGRAPSESC